MRSVLPTEILSFSLRYCYIHWDETDDLQSLGFAHSDEQNIWTRDDNGNSQGRPLPPESWLLSGQIVAILLVGKSLPELVCGECGIDPATSRMLSECSTIWFKTLLDYDKQPVDNRIKLITGQFTWPKSRAEFTPGWTVWKEVPLPELCRLAS